MAIYDLQARAKAEWKAAWGALARELRKRFPKDAGEVDMADYETNLADIPAALLAIVVAQVIGSRTFPAFPTVADIRGVYVDVLRVSLPSQTDALAEIARYQDARRRGDGRAFVWSNPLARRVLEALDAHTLSVSDSPAVDRSHLMRLYGELVDRELGEARLVPAARALLRSPDIAAALLSAPAANGSNGAKRHADGATLRAVPAATTGPKRLVPVECQCGERGMLHTASAAPDGWKCPKCSAGHRRPNAMRADDRLDWPEPGEDEL